MVTSIVSMLQAMVTKPGHNQVRMQNISSLRQGGSVKWRYNLTQMSLKLIMKGHK